MTHVLVLGGGPAGYVAALRAAQLGARVTLVEARDIGGTCLNRGCIPTKAMVAAAERLRLARSAATYGIVAADARLDYPAMAAHRDAAAAQLREGVEHLLKDARSRWCGRAAGWRARAPWSWTTAACWRATLSSSPPARSRPGCRSFPRTIPGWSAATASSCCPTSRGVWSWSAAA